ncbi:MAG: hypothetical protein ABIH86_04945 [Planctomycetota bacterium]
MSKPSKKPMSFADQSERILALTIDAPVNENGGYGPGGEVIFTSHPINCPSVLADKRGAAKATFMTNGSTIFSVQIKEGLTIEVLKGHFDPVEKVETGVPSHNLWISLDKKTVASLINPNVNLNLEPVETKIIKLGDPNRALWFCSEFQSRGVRLQTAVKLTLVDTASGPAILRAAYIKNVGKKPADAMVWTLFRTPGTQQFVYNKSAWYDQGLPLTKTESIVSAVVPYTDVVQLKRMSTGLKNAKAVAATCDYVTFVGTSGASSLFPQAILNGGMLKGGAGDKLNRFSTASATANQFEISLAPGQSAEIVQSLLYVTDEKALDVFKAKRPATEPTYGAMSAAYKDASQALVKLTPDAKAISALSDLRPAERSPYFSFSAPAERAVTEYANSVWTGVTELYENCRAHGAMLAEGIELGTRDRGQDMWPKMKEEPGVVRADLVHALSMMYLTQDQPVVVRKGKPLTLPEKLHGMFPRQYPSRWTKRNVPIRNDNRPYTDSPVWLLNSLFMYLKETGDLSILTERVGTTRLTDPENPIHSSMIGGDKTYTIAEIVFEVLECFERHCSDSPYGLIQILYGDWCDPIDMFGTNPVGDPTSRGKGRGAQIRLSAHVFLTAIDAIDVLSAKNVRAKTSSIFPAERIESLKRYVNRLRASIIEWGWEKMPAAGQSGFLNCIHEFRKDGSTPDYAKGETGYTLGSLNPAREFDGRPRRELGGQAFCLKMLTIHRDYLEPLPVADALIKDILLLIDTMMANPKLGLTMYTVPIANDTTALKLVGRMGIVPSGTAENGEYHHNQAFMHRYRLDVQGQADAVLKNFKPMMSALRDATIGGPFDMPTTSYCSDPKDPHFSKGMYFGLSGSVDWMVEIFQLFAGLTLNLCDDSQPDAIIEPNLPSAFKGEASFGRIIFAATGPGVYKQVPVEIHIRRTGKTAPVNKINGKIVDSLRIENVKAFDALKIEIN